MIHFLSMSAGVAEKVFMYGNPVSVTWGGCPVVMRGL